MRRRARRNLPRRLVPKYLIGFVPRQLHEL